MSKNAHALFQRPCFRGSTSTSVEVMQSADRLETRFGQPEREKTEPTGGRGNRLAVRQTASQRHPEAEGPHLDPDLHSRSDGPRVNLSSPRARVTKRAAVRENIALLKCEGDPMTYIRDVELLGTGRRGAAIG
jgi:hypothetical protein